MGRRRTSISFGRYLGSDIGMYETNTLIYPGYEYGRMALYLLLAIIPSQAFSTRCYSLTWSFHMRCGFCNLACWFTRSWISRLLLRTILYRDSDRANKSILAFFWLSWVISKRLSTYKAA